MIKIAIIGCSRWGANYVRIFDELEASTVTRVCDLCTERLDDVRRRHPSVHAHTCVQALLGDDDLDAVVVSTPATTHYGLVRQCLLAGKHVLAEKPLTTTVDEAEELLRLARQAGKVLMVGHVFLHNPGVHRIKQIVTAQGFGRLLYLRATRTHAGPVRQDVNVAWDLAPHDVSIFNYLLEAQPRQVRAVGRQLLGNGKPDEVFITLIYSGGVVGHIHVSWADPHRVREIVAIGSRGRVVFDDTQARLQVLGEGRVDELETAQIRREQVERSISRVKFSEPLKNQGHHFLTCIREGRVPLTDGANGRDVVKVMVAIDRSLQRDGQAVCLKPTPSGVGVSPLRQNMGKL